MGSASSTSNHEISIVHTHLEDDSAIRKKAASQKQRYPRYEYGNSKVSPNYDDVTLKIMKEKQEEILKDVRETVALLKTLNPKDENGRANQRYNETVARILFAFSSNNTWIQQEEKNNYRQKVAKEISPEIITQFCDFSIETYNINYLSEEGQDDYFELILLKLILYLLEICSDRDTYPEASSLICDHPTYLAETAKHLEKIYHNEWNIQSESVMYRILSFLRHASMVDSNVPKIRQHNFVDILTLYLGSEVPKIRFLAIAIMAEIVDEEESEILQKGSHSFEYIQEAFQQAMRKSSRRHPWLQVTVWELIRIVKQIARNDTNKKAIVDHGFLPLLVELAHSDDLREHKEAVATLRTLSFDKDNQKLMIERGNVVDIFVELALESPDENVTKICKGAIWTMREELQKSNQYKDLPIVKRLNKDHFSDLEETQNRWGLGSDNRKGHVMISYQWSNQEVLVRIKDNLRKNGFKVWMDIDDMAGSTLEAMARAVEAAEVVLVCLSRKYKDSDNCRAEAEYAFEKRKTIIPLKLEKGYKPDGWLGIIVGSKKFYDFGGKYTFESRVDDLVKELKTKLSLQSDQNQIEERKHSKNDEPADNDTWRTKHVKEWTKDDIEQWLTKHGLKRDRFASLEGVEIVFLQLLLDKSVDVYYKTLTEQLKITDLNTMAKFTSALEDTTL